LAAAQADSSGAAAHSPSDAGNGLYQGATSVVPEADAKRNGALAPAGSSFTSSSNSTILIEGGYDGPDGAAPKKQTRRLNPIRQKQMEERCAFLEEEIPRVEASIAHTEEQLGVYVSATETQRLAALAQELRAQLAAFTSEWEELMGQLDVS
jgi:ATP-binding cassette subfamily F protein 3